MGTSRSFRFVDLLSIVEGRKGSEGNVYQSVAFEELRFVKYRFGVSGPGGCVVTVCD